MNRLPFLAAVLALVVSGGFAHAQMTAQDARSQGEAIGTGVRDTTNGSILANGAEANVPTYAGTDFPTLDYVDDPTGLSTAGEAARYQQDYQTVVDPYRKVVDPATIDLSSATAIEKDPDTYLGPGVGPGGSTGTCNPLPPGGRARPPISRAATRVRSHSMRRGLAAHPSTSSSMTAVPRNGATNAIPSVSLHEWGRTTASACAAS